MTTDELQDYRVQRLQELLDRKFHGKRVELGRALGYKSGAFVRQLLERERQITEKTIIKVHELPGCGDWFNQAAPALPLKSAVAPIGPRDVAHDVSYTAFDDPPITAWEVVVSLEKLPVIPSDLMVQVPDDALAARGLLKGELIWFKACDSAEPRNVVLIEANGRRYIRRFTESGKAEALDSAFDSFDPGEFKVVAVMHMRPSKSI